MVQASRLHDSTAFDDVRPGRPHHKGPPIAIMCGRDGRTTTAVSTSLDTRDEYRVLRAFAAAPGGDGLGRDLEAGLGQAALEGLVGVGRPDAEHTAGSETTVDQVEA